MKLEDDFERFVASAVVIGGLIYFIDKVPAPEWKILLWIAAVIGMMKTIWTKK